MIALALLEAAFLIAAATNTAAPTQTPTQASPADPAAPRRAEMEYRAALFRGARALESEDFATAEELLQRAIRLQPGAAPGHYQLGRALAGLKRLKPAAGQFETTLKIEPRHTGAIMGLAAIDEGTGDFAAADRRYRDVLALGANPRAQRSLASLLGRVGRSQEAETLLSSLLAADPNDADSRFELALARAIQGDCAAAIPDFRKVLVAQPKRITALFQLGNCLSRTGKIEEAETVLSRFREASEAAKRLKEVEKKVHFILLEADSLAGAGKMEAALAKGREAVAADPGSGSAHAFLGSLLTDAGRLDEALSELKRAAEIDPSDVLSLNEAGRLLAIAGRNDEALSFLKRAASADVNAAEPHRFLALLYRQMGRPEDAEREKAIYLKLSHAP